MRRLSTARVGSGGRAAAIALLFALLGAAGAAPDPNKGDPGAADPAPPSDDARPAAGRFLVATEQIQGSIFFRSVVFLVRYAESGALGLIVNRPTDVTLHDVLQGAGDGAGQLYVGGPVERASVMVLLRADSPPQRAVHVAGDVFMTVDPDVLRELSAKLGGGANLRVYAGYAGWSPGQLDREIARGDWIVADAPTRSIFDDAPGELWQKLHLKHHRLIARGRRAGARSG